MKRYSVFLIQLFMLTICSAQSTKIIDIPLIKNSIGGVDTSTYFINYSTLRYQLKLPNLQFSSDSFHFRIWAEKQAVDIWTTNGKFILGSVTNFAQRYNKKLMKKSILAIDKVLSNTTNLKPRLAKYIFDFITAFNLNKISTDSKIKGWKRGFGETEYCIEFSDTHYYAFKQYWAPSVYANSIIEAKTIDQFVNYVFTDLQIGTYYKNLKLPNADYKTNYYGEPMLNFPILNTFYKTSIFDWLL